MLLPDPSLPWPIPMEAVAIGAEREGCFLTAYLCPAGVPSIGYGETDGITLGMKWTKQTADTAFCHGLTERANQVRAACSVPPNDNQLGAMTLLAYNIGVPTFLKSSILRLHNKGDYNGASRAFSLYDKARDPKTKQLVTLDGLVTRRAQESALYLKPVEGAPQPLMAQAVAAESSLSTSPINAGGTVAAGTGALALLSEFSEYTHGILTAIKQFAADAGVNPGMVIGGVLLAAGIAVVYWRFKQRSGGWV